MASVPGRVGPLLSGTRDLAGSSAPLLAGSCPVFSADVTFVCQQHLFRHDNLRPHWSAHLLQTSLVPRRLCVFILFYFFPISTSLGPSLMSHPLLRSHFLPGTVLHDPSQGFLSSKVPRSCQSPRDLSPDDLLVQELFVWQSAVQGKVTSPEILSSLSRYFVSPRGLRSQPRPCLLVSCVFWEQTRGGPGRGSSG